MVVFRPRAGSGTGASSLTKLEVDLRHPTQHDARVLESLTWEASRSDRDGHRAIDGALDVERVTRAFFEGLKLQFAGLREAVQQAADDQVAVANQLKRYEGDGVDRVALRILTQVLFCQFLQRKGLIESRPDWLTWAYGQKHGPYYRTVLEPLFYDGFGTPTDARRAGIPDVPYLNGGLFERAYGPVSLDLPDEVFDPDEGLLGYLDGWTFTIAEDMPDEAEVAVDPEMLGKVFEHLADVENVKERGTVYTPRPVVQLMCREALVPWLEERCGLAEDQARLLLVEPDPFGPDGQLRAGLGTDAVAAVAERVPQQLDDLRVLDPAVGSGAFPLGMLAEVVRLRSLCYVALNGEQPRPEQLFRWKAHAVAHVLTGVDIEPRAIELCRLRLWLALIIDLPDGEPPDPLPNLDYRTFTADSLVDFVEGVEVQRTRGGFDFLADDQLGALHDAWFGASGPDRQQLRAELSEIEDREAERLLRNARAGARTDEARQRIDDMRSRFHSVDRQLPCFVPGLHAPEVAGRGGWDVVIMNPPYVGRKEVRRRLSKERVKDLELHYGGTSDLMVHFARRALELARPGGVVSMIFNDSIFTSTDAQDVRRTWTTTCEVRTLARTKCFEGRAIIGGVVVAALRPPEGDAGTRWIEAFRKPVADLAEASDPVSFRVAKGRADAAGEVEVWCPPSGHLRRLPHRPLFRPSPEALSTLDRFEGQRSWADEWSRWDASNARGWTLLSNTRALDRRKDDLSRTGFYDRLEPGDWVPLGLVVEGGQGLATADDKRFLAAVEGTALATEHLARRERLIELTLAHHEAAARFRRLAPAQGDEAALLAVWEQYGGELRWPRVGGFRVAPEAALRRTPLSEDERADGLSGARVFVPFEKGDDSDEVDGQRIGAAWWRENPVVIDWSTDAVRLLRERAGHSGPGRPYFRNEQSWFREGVTWNRIASYLRVRQVPSTAIFSSEAPTVRSTQPWLPPHALLALLNASTLDYVLRTFLGSRMHIEIGDVRRIPVPVLDADQSARLDALGAAAVAAKRAGEAHALDQAEVEVDALVAALYGLPADADLWVVR